MAEVQKIRPARTDTYEHTISGLLTKRREMFTEAERIRDRLAEIRNDIQALDRTLATLGFDGDLDATTPPAPECDLRQGRTGKGHPGRAERRREALTLKRNRPSAHSYAWRRSKRPKVHSRPH